MGATEYIVRFKGDYSALAKDIQKINGETKKIADDEVIIKLNYDGNIQEFNKVFSKIEKMHPELGIQFQYNVNQKMLEQEMDKLDKLTKLQIDIDEGQAQTKLNKLGEAVENAVTKGMSKEDVGQRIKDFYSYYNTALKAGAKNLDIGDIERKIDDAFRSASNDLQKIWEDTADKIDRYKLFNIDKSLIEDISNAKERIKDLEAVIESLEKKGAGKTGLPSELQKVQDEIKILRSDIKDMQDQLGNLTGKAFDEMTESIKETNRQLAEAVAMVEKLSNLKTSNGESTDTSEVEETASETAKAAKEALRKAQDSNSPAELTKPLGKDFGLGYSEGIKEAIPDIVKSCQAIVLAAYEAVKDANKEENADGANFTDGFIEKFKSSLEKALPDIQNSINEIFSKIDIGEKDRPMFINMGEQIINSIIEGLKNNNSSGNITDTLNSIINKAFSETVLDFAVRDFMSNVQKSIDTAGDFRLKHFSVDSDSIIFQVQNALNNGTYSINVGDTIQELATTLNTSADNVRETFIDVINWMRQANDWQKINTDSIHERKLLFNSKTGKFSNPTVVGDEREVKGELTQKIIDYYKKQGIIFDSDLHWHRNDKYAAPSSLEIKGNEKSGDLASFFFRAFQDNISKFMVAAQDEIAVFDFSKVASSATGFEKFLEDWIKENFDEISDVLKGDNIRLNNPRETIGLYISKIYKDLWDNIENQLKEDYKFIANSQIGELTEELYEDFEENHGLKSNDGTVPFAELFPELLDALKAKADNIEEVSDGFDTVITLMLKYFKLELEDAENSGNDIDRDSIKQMARNAVERMNFKGDGAELKDIFIESLYSKMSDLIMDSYYTSPVTKKKENALHQQAGSMAMQKLIAENALVGKFVKYYNPEQFEDEFGKGILKNVSDQQDGKNGTQVPISPITSAMQSEVKAVDQAIKSEKEKFNELITKISQDVPNAIEVKNESFNNELIKVKEVVGDEISELEKLEHKIEEVNLKGNNRNFSPSDTTIPSVIDKITQAENEMGNETQESTDQAKQGLAEMREEARKTIEVFRGLDFVGSNGISNNGVTFTSDNPNVAALYQMSRDSHMMGGRFFKHGEILKELIDTSNMFSVDAEGRRFDSIQYWGDQTTTEGQKIKKTYDELINKLKEYLPLVKEAFGNDIQFKDLLNLNLDNMSSDDFDKMQSLMEVLSEAQDNSFTPKNITQGFSSIYESYSQLKEYIDSNPLVGIWNTNSFVEEIQRLGYAVLEIKNVIDSHNGIAQDLANDYVVIDSSAIKNVEKYTEDLSELTKVRLKYGGVIKYSNMSSDELLKNDFVDSEDRYVSEVLDYAVSKYGTDNYQEIFKTLFSNDVEAKKKLAEEIVKYREQGKVELQKALNNTLTLSNETPVSTESTNAETKALLSKKEVVEQLRAELNLTQKAAEDLFDQQGYAKTNNKYQIEQTAVDELITSLKEKKQIEESQGSSTTSPTVNVMQSEVEAVNQAIEAEKKKFDELKNKISKTIPDAINKKNEAFEKERDLVANVVDDEIDYFDILKNSVDGVTDSIKTQYDTTKNAKPKTESSDVKPADDTPTESSKPRKVKTDLSSLDKIEEKIKEIGLSAEDTQKAIDLLGGGEKTFFWLNRNLEDQWDKVNDLIDIYKQLGIVINSVDDSNGFSTTVTTNPLENISGQRYQSIGQKSKIQQQMAEYYTAMQKEADEIYSNAQDKTTKLLQQVGKLENSSKYTEAFKTELANAKKELEDFLELLKGGTIPFEEVNGKVKELADNVENTLSKKAFKDVKLAAEKSLTNVGLKIDQIIAKNSAMGESFKSKFKALKDELDDQTTVEGVQKIIAEVNRLESEIIAAGKTGKSFIDQVKQRLRDINSKYIAQYFSFQDIIRYARQAAQNIIQLNDAFIELSKVSDASLKELEADFQSYADIAKSIGGTITDTISATADWARMGMI